MQTCCMWDQGSEVDLLVHTKSRQSCACRRAASIPHVHGRAAHLLPCEGELINILYLPQFVVNNHTHEH